MRYSRRYVILGILVACALFLKFQSSDNTREQVKPFRGAVLKENVWNPLIANSVNDKPISITVDAKSYKDDKASVFMDDKLNLMVPVQMLRDSFDCSAHLYAENELLVEKYSDEVMFSLDKDEVMVNEEIEKISSGMRQVNGEYYVPLEALSDSLGYSYSWNMHTFLTY